LLQKPADWNGVFPDSVCPKIQHFKNNIQHETKILRACRRIASAAFLCMYVRHRIVLFPVYLCLSFQQLQQQCCQFEQNKFVSTGRQFGYGRIGIEIGTA
jgi:hypothetical protein